MTSTRAVFSGAATNRRTLDDCRRGLDERRLDRDEGKSTRKVEPLPTALSTSMVPPKPATIV